MQRDKKEGGALGCSAKEPDVPGTGTKLSADPRGDCSDQHASTECQREKGYPAKKPVHETTSSYEGRPNGLRSSCGPGRPPSRGIPSPPSGRRTPTASRAVRRAHPA